MEHIGFIGLGIMGSGMAKNIQQAGLPLVVCNRSQSKLQWFADQGTATATDPCSLADKDIVVTMVSDDNALEAVMVQSGLLQKMKPGSIHLSCSTISIDFCRALDRLHKEHGCQLVAAPVSGRGDFAEAGQLFVLAAGESNAMERCSAIFHAIGQRITTFGTSPESAIVAKLAVNQMIASSLVVMGESMAMLERYGLDSSAFYSFYSNALFACPVFKAYGRIIAERDYVPANFSAQLGLKDLRLVQDAAAKVQASMPVADLVREQMQQTVQAGMQDSDWAAVTEINRKGLDKGL